MFIRQSVSVASAVSFLLTSHSTVGNVICFRWRKQVFFLPFLHLLMHTHFKRPQVANTFLSLSRIHTHTFSIIDSVFTRQCNLLSFFLPHQIAPRHWLSLFLSASFFYSLTRHTPFFLSFFPFFNSLLLSSACLSHSLFYLLLSFFLFLSRKSIEEFTGWTSKLLPLLLLCSVNRHFLCICLVRRRRRR